MVTIEQKALKLLYELEQARKLVHEINNELAELLKDLESTKSGLNDTGTSSPKETR